MNGGSMRFWESQYDINTPPNMMNSPHGWSAWRLYGLWYLYQLTGGKEYLRQAMNGLGSCVQLIDFKDGDLRWGFIPDPCIHARVFEQDPATPGMGVWNPRVIGEQYMPMISGWYRAKPNTWSRVILVWTGKWKAAAATMMSTKSSNASAKSPSPPPMFSKTPTARWKPGTAKPSGTPPEPSTSPLPKPLSHASIST
jgi:hypothetical protein